MKSIKFRIVAGLVGVAFMVVLFFALFTAFNTKRLFSNYLDEYQLARQWEWARILEDHYALRNSWQGVNQILPVTRDHGMMQGRRVASGEIVILMGSQGELITATERLDSILLPENIMKEASPIQYEGLTVGYVYLAVERQIPGFATMEEQFLRSVYYFSLGMGFLLVAIAIGVGISFGRRLTDPLRKLTDTAKRITGGQWEVAMDLAREDEIGELSRAFHSMLQRLQETERARKTLVADVAHELRNPLATLRAQLESIQDGVSPADPQVILSLNDEVIRLGKLVNDLQALSLADVGKLRLHLQKGSLQSVIEKTLHLYEGLMKEKKITLETQIEEVPDLNFDMEKMTQVLVNLFTNALRHTPEGKKISVRYGEITGFAKLELYNEGDPIAEKDLPHIFDRFYRSDEGRSREQGGTGLGLAIVKSLVEAHGGEIGVSNENNGVTFYLTLPKIREV